MKYPAGNHTEKPFRDLEGLALLSNDSEHFNHSHSIGNIPFQRKRKTHGPLEQLFSSKRKTLKATVTALLEEVKNRQDLSGRLLGEIENDIGARNAYLAHLKALNVHYIPDTWKEINKARMRLQGDLLNLQREKRKEDLECWRDLMSLRKYLLSALREYWDLIKRSEMLSSDFAESR